MKEIEIYFEALAKLHSLYKEGQSNPIVVCVSIAHVNLVSLNSKSLSSLHLLYSYVLMSDFFT